MSTVSHSWRQESSATLKGETQFCIFCTLYHEIALSVITYIQTYINTYIHSHTHTHTHKYTYTHAHFMDPSLFQWWLEYESAGKHYWNVVYYLILVMNIHKYHKVSQHKAQNITTNNSQMYSKSKISVIVNIFDSCVCRVYAVYWGVSVEVVLISSNKHLQCKNIQNFYCLYVKFVKPTWNSS